MLAWLCADGCMVGPNYHPPAAAVPDRWAGPVPDPAAVPPGIDLAQWWTVFDDPILTSLDERAVRSNLDLKQAEARIRQARAARGIAASGLGPTVDGTGAVQRSRNPGRNSGWTDGETRGVVSNSYQAGFDAGWELDIFGGIRRNIEAADADLLAAVENRRDVLVILTAEVARNYIELRAFQQRIDIARQNLATQEHSARLTRQRFEGGFRERPGRRQRRRPGGDHGLPDPVSGVGGPAVHLCPRHPAGPGAGRPAPGAVDPRPPSRPRRRRCRPGVPSELLRRRPDIRQAEADIHAATRADRRRPRPISSPGSRSPARPGCAPGSQFLARAGPAGSGRFGPSVSWRVFDTGRTRSAIEQQEALQEQTLHRLPADRAPALQEVENALIASAKEQERREALVSAVTANRKAVSLSKTLYTQGQTDFLSVLDAQRSLFVTEEALVQSTSTVSTDLVALYKALGGGWSEDSGDGRGSQPN